MTQPVPKTWNRKPLTVASLMAWTREGEGGCVLWTRYLNHDGYGRAMCEGCRWTVHRLIWALHHGPVPDGYEIDHICFTPACVNIDHLQPLTVVENRARHESATRDTCSKGHPFSGDNLRVVQRLDGRSVRRCRICARTAMQKAVARNLEPGAGLKAKPVRTHCKRGHEFTPENTYTQPSRPWVHTCRECKRARR